MIERIKERLFGCEGCAEEFQEACGCVEEGYHVATTTKRNFLQDRHIAILIVDDNGKVIIE